MDFNVRFHVPSDLITKEMSYDENVNGCINKHVRNLHIKFDTTNDDEYYREQFFGRLPSIINISEFIRYISKDYWFQKSYKGIDLFLYNDQKTVKIKF